MNAKPGDAYDAAYSRWIHDPDEFWTEAAESVHWDR